MVCKKNPLCQTLFLAIFALLLLGLLARQKGNNDALLYEYGTLSIAGASISVEIPLEKSGFEKGLGGRTALATDNGMLFLCLPQNPKFWMKDMRFPIDIIWINDAFLIADITREVAHDTYPNTFSPRENAAHALEVSAGFAAKHGISRGDEVFGLGGSICDYRH